MPEDARPAQPSSEKGRGFLQTLREALQLFWTVADSWIKRRLLVALALVAGGAVLAALTPVGLKLLIDALAQPDSARHPANGAMLGDRLLFIGPTALVVLYAIGQFLTRGSLELRQYTHASAEQRLRRNVGRRLFAHLVRLPLQFHLGRKTGAMGETAEQGIHGYQLLLNHAVYTVLPVFVELGVVAVVLIHFGQPLYVLILAASSLAYVVAFHRGVTAVTHSTTLVAKSHLDAQAILTDSLLSYETIKYFDAEGVVCNRYDRALGRMEIAWRGFYTHRMRNGLTIAAIFATSLGCSLWLAAGDVARGAMTVGDFVMVNAYILRLVQPLELLGYAVRDITQGVAFLQSLLDLLEEQPEKDTPRTAGERHAARGELTFDRVSFSYQQERSLLKDVSFSVPAGHTVAIVGASGVGKSSIIRLLFRLYAPTGGRILLDGVPTADMPLSELRQAIGVVPQDTVLFDDTIANNIGLGRVGSTMTEIARAARVAHLHETIEALPEGYETLVGERGLRLSGGERQRVAIARAALKAPRIFVFDEATASLDSRTEGEILRNLAAVSAESTTLIIAHRLSTIVHANRIIVLDRGEIVEQGTHAELLATSGIYAGMWLAQQGSSGQSAESHAAPVAMPR